MAGDILSFSLLTLSSIIIIVNPLSATLIYVSLTTNLDPSAKVTIAKDSCRFALLLLLSAAILGTWILQLFGITLEAFRIAGGILLFGIGMEMVYAKVSRTKLTATEKYESRENDDVAIMPLAIPMIAGPGAITTTIVMMNEAIGMTPFAIGVVLGSIGFSIGITYYMMRNSDYIMKRVGQREYRAINRLMGMLLIAIAVQFVINGIKIAFPLLTGGS
jgi:multiple antibiotic resistance protein